MTPTNSLVSKVTPLAIITPLFQGTVSFLSSSNRSPSTTSTPETSISMEPKAADLHTFTTRDYSNFLWEIWVTHTWIRVSRRIIT